MVMKLDKLIKKKATVNELANDVFEDTGKHLSDCRALGCRSYYQTIKKSLTLVQEKSKVFFSQRYLKSNIKKWFILR